MRSPQLAALRDCLAADDVDGATFDVLAEQPPALSALGLTEPQAQQVAAAFRRLQQPISDRTPVPQRQAVELAGKAAVP